MRSDFGKATELDLAFLLEEAGQIFFKDHGNTGEVPDSGNDSASFKLRKEAGGKTRKPTEFYEAHRTAEAHGPDSFADLLIVDLLLDAGWVDGDGVEVGNGEWLPDLWFR